jgi:hypothetical protein
MIAKAFGVDLNQITQQFKKLLLIPFDQFTNRFNIHYILLPVLKSLFLSQRNTEKEVESLRSYNEPFIMVCQALILTLLGRHDSILC